jgi:hypothetical protein
METDSGEKETQDVGLPGGDRAATYALQKDGISLIAAERQRHIT